MSLHILCKSLLLYLREVPRFVMLRVNVGRQVVFSYSVCRPEILSSETFQWTSQRISFIRAGRRVTVNTMGPYIALSFFRDAGTYSYFDDFI
jgi:hypothetical protein